MKIELELSKDKMEAYIVILPSGEEKEEYVSRDIILDFLKQRGVVYGIKELPENFVTKKRYLVAEGKRPVPGKDAHIEILFDSDKIIKPKLLEDGRVDYRALDVVEVVRKGDPLAKRIPPTEGIPGINVMGEEVPAKPGRDISIPHGLNVETSDIDKNLLVAKIDGQVVEEDGRIGVIPIYEVKGDLDFSVGNIKFPGDVIIRKNVKPGFKIEAEGKVEVYESAEECEIIAQGDIIIRKSFIGKEKSYLRAVGNVIVGFIDGGKVLAGGNVVSHSAIMHSSIEAGEKVVVKGKGIITGGEIIAGRGITANIVGSKFGTVTGLKIKRKKGIEKQLTDLRDKVSKNRNLINQLNVKIRTLNPTFDIEKLRTLLVSGQLKLSGSQILLLKKLIATHDKLNEEIEEIEREIQVLNKEVEKFKNATITIKNVIFPGAVIMFGDIIYNVREDLKFVKFYLENGEIKFTQA